MKSINVFFGITLLSLFGTFAAAQTISVADSTGLPGDNFSLEGALELFKQSDSPEDFEQKLNTEDNHVNNLDLNEDGQIDYIRVVDRTEGDAHALVLQAIISGTESQDIAVIELEKTSNDQAVLQIVGDEEIYGDETILEPTEAAPSNTTKTVVVNVWTWPAVRFMYAPRYVVWVSPWAWRHYPAWWRPWHPVRWHVFYGYRAPYHRHYAVVHTHRVVRARRIYAPVRTTSVTVHNRYGTATRTTTVHRNGTVTRTRTTRRRKQ